MDHDFAGKKIILFGTGVFYQKFKEYAFRKSDVIALVDNDKTKQGSIIDGISVIAPDAIAELGFDYVALFLKHETAVQVRRQLASLGVDEKKFFFMTSILRMFAGGSINFTSQKESRMLRLLTGNWIIVAVLWPFLQRQLQC